MPFRYYTRDFLSGKLPDNMSILDSVGLFESLDSNERDTLSLFCQERFLRAGEVLFNE